MAVTYNRMKIDVNAKPEDIITVVQDDSDSRYLDVFLFDNGVPVDLTGHEVRIYMRKPEKGGEVFNNGEITEPENGRCQFLLTTAALERVGYLKTQISIWKDNKEILSTQIFNIFVTESLRTTGSIEASNEYGALVVLFQNLYQSIDLMTDMVQNFGKAGEVAAGIPVSTYWGMLETLYSMNKKTLDHAMGSLKQTCLTEEKSVNPPSTGTATIVEYDFEFPVKFNYVKLRRNENSNTAGLNYGKIYFINGENSISFDFNCYKGADNICTFMLQNIYSAGSTYQSSISRIVIAPFHESPSQNIFTPMPIDMYFERIRLEFDYDKNMKYPFHVSVCYTED